MVLTRDMTQIHTVVLHAVDMSARSWIKFITSLLDIQHIIRVLSRVANIDDDTLDVMRSHFTLILDDGIKLEGRHSWLEFTNILSQGTC